jgi:hypothetical protein
MASGDRDSFIGDQCGRADDRPRAARIRPLRGVSAHQGPNWTAREQCGQPERVSAADEDQARGASVNE